MVTAFVQKCAVDEWVEEGEDAGKKLQSTLIYIYSRQKRDFLVDVEEHKSKDICPMLK